ncbi:MAG: aldehyde dehydrogenase family protein [Nitrososphaerota archaeon]|nr:aldehyde dehydrogenase family protein [Nitrososphaerota archaeon]
MFDDCSVVRDGVQEFLMLIDGRWKTSKTGGTFGVHSPIDGGIVAKAQAGGAADVELAVSAAHGAKKKIRDIPAIDRIDILNRARHIIEDHRKNFVNTLVLEAGKPVKLAEAEVAASLNRIKMTMEEARRIFGEYVPGDWSEDTMQKFALVIHEPMGVIACVSPFNYPLFSTVAKVIPALVSGNTTVIKPASDDPIAAILFARILHESGIPAGAVNIVTGSGRDVGDPLVSHPLVQMVTLTGSTETGRHVAGLAVMKKLHLELGGKGSAIIAPDASLALAAGKVCEGSLKYSGQRCDAISRVLVERSVADAFLSHLLREFERWKMGDPRDAQNNMGPLIDEKAAERVQTMVDDAVSKGAKLLKGGTHKGAYFEPTIIDNVSLDSQIAWEETFGPVITIVRVESVDVAIQLANKSHYGLDSCIFTESLYIAWKAAKGLEEGSVSINDAPSHGVGYFPFGGNKDSGLGREGVGYSIDEMTRIKTIQFNLSPAGLGKSRAVTKL